MALNIFLNFVHSLLNISLKKMFGKKMPKNDYLLKLLGKIVLQQMTITGLNLQSF